nr:hypothetical protein [Tanacetum cinerariifolium]
MPAWVLNCLAFKLEEIVMAMMTCLKSSGVHYQCFTVKCGLLWGGLLGIIIPAARVFCFCWDVFIPAGDLFLLAALIFSLGVSLVVLLAKITSGRLVNGSPCGGIDMVIEYLNLEPKIDAMRHHIVPIGEINGVSIALVAREKDKNTCNNDKNLSEIQLEHEKEDELVVVVVVKVVHELDCIMVVKEIENRLLEEMEKLGWWFEQDIGGESEDDKEKRLVIVYSFEEIGVQEWTFMMRVLTNSRDDIGRQGDVLRRRRRVGMK